MRRGPHFARTRYPMEYDTDGATLPLKWYAAKNYQLGVSVNYQLNAYLLLPGNHR